MEEAQTPWCVLVGMYVLVNKAFVLRVVIDSSGLYGAEVVFVKRNKLRVKYCVYIYRMFRNERLGNSREFK